MFLKSMDASDMVKDAQLLFCLLNEVFMEVGVENIVQVITENASNYVAKGRMLEEKHPTIWWIPCAIHYSNLMLEDIGKIEWMKKCVEQEKFITKYMYNHTWVLNLVKKNIGARELVWSTITRFAANFISLQSVVQQKSNLRKMFLVMNGIHLNGEKRPKGKRWLTKCLKKYCGKR
jgi:hypothetical protein